MLKAVPRFAEAYNLDGAIYYTVAGFNLVRKLDPVDGKDLG